MGSSDPNVPAGAPGQLLEWDTDFWGVRVGRADAGAELADVERWAASEKLDVVMLLVSADRIEHVVRAEAHDFRVVDVRVTLSRRGPSASSSSTTSVRRHRPSDVPALEEIASRSHRDARFYADERFPRERCDALYRTWIANACGGRSEAVFVAVDEKDDPIGYLSCRVVDGADTIDLVAVDERARGRGLGRGLVDAALGWAARKGRAELRVTTQGRNIGALAFYESLGFRTSDLGLWLHRWSDP